MHLPKISRTDLVGASIASLLIVGGFLFFSSYVTDPKIIADPMCDWVVCDLKPSLVIFTMMIGLGALMAVFYE